MLRVILLTLNTNNSSGQCAVNCSLEELGSPKRVINGKSQLTPQSVNDVCLTKATHLSPASCHFTQCRAYIS